MYLPCTRAFAPAVPRASRAAGHTLATVGCLLAAAAAGAQPPPLACSPHAHDEDPQHIGLARMYAPLLWLAPDEPLYPMLPHPFAFDGIDNDNDGRCDLGDLDELRMDTGDVLQLQHRLSRLGPSHFVYPYTPGDAPDDPEAKSAIHYGEFAATGPISAELRAKFAAKGVVLTPYTVIAPVDRRVSEIRSYEAVARLDRRALAHLPVCPRPPCPRAAIGTELRALLAAAGVDGVSFIELREGGWFLYAEAGAPADAWSLRLQPSGDEIDVFGTGHQTFTATRNLEAREVSIIHASRLPPPRVLYHHNRTPIEGRELTQYWSYYLFDLGTGAHRHDGEHVFSFRDDIGTVRCVVGAGHTDASANNVLVASPEARQNILRPIRLPNHMPFLVELGKHASAPDRGLDGRFDIGMDANVFYKDVWGTRDLAAAIGVSSLRPVQPRFAFPRDLSTLIVGRDWSEQRFRVRAAFDERDAVEGDEDGGSPAPGAAPPTARKGDFGVGSAMGRNEPQAEMDDTSERLTALDVVYMLSTDPVASKFRDVTRDVAGTAPRPSRGSCASRTPRYVDADGYLTYELFPIEDYAHLVDVLLRNACAGGDTADCVDADSVAAWLDTHRTCFWGSQAPDSVGIDEAVFAEMATWPERIDAKRDVWRHNNFKHPNDIFKPWLFPRAAIFAASMWESADYRLRGGLRFSTGFTPNSVIELSASFAVKGRAFQDVLATYYFFRGSHQGWYASVGRGGGGRDAPFTILSAGFVPFSWDLPALPVVGDALSRLGHNQLMVHTGLRGEIDDFPDEVSPIKFQIGVSLARSVAGPRHPLRY